MSVHMQAISAANREAIPQTHLADSFTWLQETLECVDTSLGQHTGWSSQWGAVLVGSTEAGSPPPCSGAESQCVMHLADDGESKADSTLVVAFSGVTEQVWRRPEGDEQDPLRSIEPHRGSGLRRRPARLSTLMLQAVAANRSAASSVDQGRLWSILRAPTLGEHDTARRFDGVGRLGTIAVVQG